MCCPWSLGANKVNIYNGLYFVDNIFNCILEVVKWKIVHAVEMPRRGPLLKERNLYSLSVGRMKDQSIPGGGLETYCQGCGKRFVLKTYAGKCPECGGVHAVSPPRSINHENIRFSGVGYVPE